MAFRRRIGSTSLQSVSYLCRALPAGFSPAAAAEPTYLGRRVGHNISPPPMSLARPLADFFLFRSFAAPAQVKTKQKAAADDNNGPRVNNAITAPFVRLVTDQGHDVLPRHEALQRAARLNLDLVEVDRKADPPVCKIMDFHKQKYKKEVNEKERLKTKSALTLRGGENKEVRFRGKTELKDLKVKADAITRLMERGYRVKCTAVPSGSSGEEDLGGLLSRLLGLIEDVSIVESGPHFDSRQVHVIVRHVKFATKKAGKKVSKAMENAGKGSQNAASEIPVSANGRGDETALQDEEWEQAESDSEADNRAPSDDVGKKSMHLSSESTTQRVGSTKANLDMGKGENNQELQAVETNRYAARRQQTRDNSQSSSQGRFSQDPRRNENEGRFPVSNNQRPFQPFNRPSPSPSGGKFNQGRLPQDPKSNENDGHFPRNNSQRQFQPFHRHSPSPSDEKFTAQKLPGLSKQGRSEAGDNATTPPTKSFGIFSTAKSATSTEPRKTRDAATSESANPGPKGYGNFSSPKSTFGGDKSAANKTACEPANNSSPTPKFGIFGSTNRTGSSDQSNSTGSNAGSPGNTSPPTPRFGIFDAKRAPASNNRS